MSLAVGLEEELGDEFGGDLMRLMSLGVIPGVFATTKN
jgi:hypothetical protein